MRSYSVRIELVPFGTITNTINAASYSKLRYDGDKCLNVKTILSHSTHAVQVNMLSALQIVIDLDKGRNCAVLWSSEPYRVSIPATNFSASALVFRMGQISGPLCLLSCQEYDWKRGQYAGETESLGAGRQEEVGRTCTHS
jgi:hypothetical protein